MISLGIGKASVSGEPEIISGKLRNEGPKKLALSEQALTNAAKDLEAEKLAPHRCLCCGKFDTGYLNELRGRYQASWAQRRNGRLFFCLAVPIFMDILFLVACFFIGVIDGLVYGIQSSFNRSSWRTWIGLTAAYGHQYLNCCWFIWGFTCS